MSFLVVVDDPARWPFDTPQLRVVAARAYLTDPAFARGSTKVINLCRAYRYQSLGYYVSLLAEARGHKALPSVNALEDLQSQTLVRVITEDLDEPIQRAFDGADAECIEVDSYFGRSVTPRHAALARRLFDLLPVPLLRAHFERLHDRWRLRSARAISLDDVSPAHRTFLIDAASAYFRSRHRPGRLRPPLRFDLAILHDPGNPEQPSNPHALRLFEKAAIEAGLKPEFITRADLGRLSEFDALFIRDTTFANHYTYHFSRRAVAQGLVVIDDPDSILRCNNKVFLAELLAAHRIPAPRTHLVHRGNAASVAAELGLPCVLKQPDSSFSRGIVKVDSEQALRAEADALLKKSELIVAQEYLPTPFDWRIGILDRRPLFVCKYYMAPGHWQIVTRKPGQRGYDEGRVEAIAVDDAPPAAIALALKTANLIGDGLYGADIKEVDGRYYVIEVNDNPNVDAGNEDGVLKDALYREIMASFVRRIEARKRVNA
jgi:glutathione synthase/RimK-type ligase-like ATP-grasp enzyme